MVDFGPFNALYPHMTEKKQEKSLTETSAEHFKEVQEEKAVKRKSFYDGLKNLAAEKFKNNESISVFIDKENNESSKMKGVTNE